MGHHLAMVNRLAWGWLKYPFTGQEVCYQKTSLNFVDSLSEILSPLLKGIKLVLATRTITQDPEQLIENLMIHKVSRLILVPSLLQAILNSSVKIELPCLKLWIVSGESLRGELIEKFQAKFPLAKLVNLYGSSEVAADATYYETNQWNSDTQPVPIGTPISNMQCYVLGSNLEVVPVGIVGELYIGGVGVARGYLNRPELTAERFIENPFVNTAERAQGINATLYRTGDLAQYLPDGNIEYLGRIDQQVKIRGFRIECGEIESVLHQHPAVKETVVIAREEEAGQARLVAYVVAKAGLLADEGAAILIQALREQLTKQLPDYMMPSSFVMLEKLPLNPNGKLDRKALPAPDKQYRTAEQAYVAPRNELEQKLVALWSVLLKIAPSKISIHDNFFTLGGHSLLIIQLMIQINELLSLPLSVADIYEHPTIISIANLASQKIINRTRSIILPIRTQGTATPLFLIHPAGGMSVPYLCFTNLDNRPVYGINTPYFGLPENFESLESMASFYIQQIKKIQTTGPYYLGGWSFGGTIALEMAQQLKTAREDAALVILMDTSNNVDTTNPAELFVDEKNMEEDINAEETFISDQILAETKKTKSLLAKYQPKAYSGRVILLKARDVNPKYSLSTKQLILEPFNGWSTILSRLEIMSVNGDHESLFNKINSPGIVRTVQHILDNNIPKIFEFMELTLLERNYRYAIEQHDEFLIKLFVKQKEENEKKLQNDSLKLLPKMGIFSHKTNLSIVQNKWIRIYEQLTNLPLIPNVDHKENNGLGFEEIKNILITILGNDIHIIDPSFLSIFDSNEASRKAALFYYGRMIAGYQNQENVSFKGNSCFEKDGGSLKKPIVMILNKQTLPNADQAIETKNIHWAVCVVLPSFYQPLVGEQLDNPHEIVFFIGSELNHSKIPEDLRALFIHGMKYQSQTSNSSETKHRILPIFPQCEFRQNHFQKQLLQPQESGWWVIYSSLIILFTGRSQLHNNISQSLQIHHIRTILNAICHQEQPILKVGPMM